MTKPPITVSQGKPADEKPADSATDNAAGAEPRFREALAGCERVLGAAHSSTLNCRKGLVQDVAKLASTGRM
jgi:hypothetical protein